jgi:hypothetical protein
MPTPGPAPSSMLAFMAAVVVTDTLPADLRNPLAKIYRDNSEGRGFSRLRDDQAPQTQPVTFLAFQATDNGCRWAIPRSTPPPAPRPIMSVDLSRLLAQPRTTPAPTPGADRA